jgi:hypothetical protein
MKKFTDTIKHLFLLTALIWNLAPARAGEGPHYENHSGALYLVYPNGDWSYIKLTPAGWVDPREAEAKKQEAERKNKSLKPKNERLNKNKNPWLGNH